VAQRRIELRAKGAKLPSRARVRTSDECAVARLFDHALWWWILEVCQPCRPDKQIILHLRGSKKKMRWQSAAWDRPGEPPGEPRFRLFRLRLSGATALPRALFRVTNVTVRSGIGPYRIPSHEIRKVYFRLTGSLIRPLSFDEAEDDPSDFR